MTKRVALITGATSGLGLAIAAKFAKQGVAVVGVGRRPDGLETIEAATGKTDVEFLQQDVCADTAPSDAVAFALSKFGRLDYLVTSAGTGSPLPVHETPDAVLDEFLSIHLRAPFRYAREALGAMKEGSAIVFMSSIFAAVGASRGGAYGAAKAGLVGLTYTMAADYGPKGIRTNAIAPGVIPTPMTYHRIGNQRFNRLMVETVPFNRQGTTDDIANAAWFLCSPEGGFVNGQVLYVDGGWSTTNFMPDEALDSRRVPN